MGIGYGIHHCHYIHPFLPPPHFTIPSQSSHTPIWCGTLSQRFYNSRSSFHCTIQHRTGLLETCLPQSQPLDGYPLPPSYFHASDPSVTLYKSANFRATLSWMTALSEVHPASVHASRQTPASSQSPPHEMMCNDWREQKSPQDSSEFLQETKQNWFCQWCTRMDEKVSGTLKCANAWDEE